jgi:tetratricopeptide (TPR) repeat protein
MHGIVYYRLQLILLFIAACASICQTVRASDGQAVPSSSSNASGQKKAAEGALAEATQLYSESEELYSQGSYEKAQQSGERALQLREEALGPDHPEVAAVLTLLGRIANGKTDYAHAADFYHIALEIA